MRLRRNSRVNAAVWRRGELLVLAGGDWTTARAINDRGWTAAHLGVGGSSANVPMFWIPGQAPAQLPIAGGSGGFATGINKSGQIVGYVYTAAGRMQAVVWRRG